MPQVKAPQERDKSKGVGTVGAISQPHLQLPAAVVPPCSSACSLTPLYITWYPALEYHPYEGDQQVMYPRERIPPLGQTPEGIVSRRVHA